MKHGIKVGAILSKDDDGTLNFLGYGIYTGDFFPEDAIGPFAEMGRHMEGYVNPRIDLDNGKHVWGCECWWGPQPEIEKLVEAARAEGKLKEHDIDEVREQWKAESAQEG